MPIKTKQIENGKLLDSIYAKIEEFEGVIATLANDNAIRKLEDVNTAGKIETLDASVEELKASTEILKTTVKDLKTNGTGTNTNILYATREDLVDLVPETENDNNTLVLLPSPRITLNDYDEDLRSKVDSTGRLPWDTIDFSYVTDVESLFSADEIGENLTVVPELKHTEHVQNLRKFFFGQKNLTETPAFENLNDCQCLSEMFSGCSKLKIIPDFPELHCAVSCYQTFYNCSELETAPVIPGVISSLQYTFAKCTSLKTVPVIKLADMKSLFGPYSVMYADGAFSDCSELEEAPEIQGTMNSVTSMFHNCKKLKTVPEYDTSECVYFRNMFSDTALSGEFPWEIDASSLHSISDTYYMFDNTSVTKVIFKNVRASVRKEIEKYPRPWQALNYYNLSSIEAVVKNYLDD